MFRVFLCVCCSLTRMVWCISTVTGPPNSRAYIRHTAYVSFPDTPIIMRSETVCPGKNHFSLRTELKWFIESSQDFVSERSRLIEMIMSVLSPDSFLLQLKTVRMSEFEETVKEFSAKLALVPIPPPGQLHVVRILHLNDGQLWPQWR